MSNKFMWTYLIHLSTHMWLDEHFKSKSWFSVTSQPYSENNNVDLKIWDDTIKYLSECQYNTLVVDVGDAIKYESHPEICAPDAWDKDFLKKKLDEIRALGMTPIPKLNFSAGHDTCMKKYRRMVSTPEYYTFCADIIREVCEVFDYPEYFHIGFDEEIARKQAPHEMIVVRGEDRWWHDFYYICRECEKYGARPWIWSDYYWDNKELFLKNMSKSVLQSNWFYGEFTDYPKDHAYYTRIETYETFDRLGFDQVPTASSCQFYNNTYQTLAFGKERMNPESLKGYMTAPWRMVNRRNKYVLIEDAYRLFYAREEFYPETLKK